MNSSVLAKSGGFETRSLRELRGNRPGVVAALFTTLLFLAGCGGNSKTATPTPTFTPVAGPYTATQYVTVADTNQSAVLYCTNDGSKPTASSVQCANPITVSQSQTLNAVAIAPGMDASSMATAQYTITATVSAPAVTGIGPANGPASGGTSVTITGSNFTGATSVNFGTVAVAASGFTVNSATSITAISPPGSGAVHVTVVTPAGSSTTSAADLFTYDVVPAPAVTGIVPSSGPAAGGTSVVITGNNFTSGTAVHFGTAAATHVQVNSATSISAVSPAGTGTVDLTVVSSGGTSATSAADQFTYISSPTITGVSPTGGPAAGGTIVNISGTGFTGATAVNFGAGAATDVQVNSSTSITAVSPAGSGTVDVRVLTPGGESATNTADEFTYVTAPPEVASISPSTGPASGGTSVTITGTYFSGATAVYFGSVAATSFKVNTPSSITVVSPESSGTVDVTVVTPGGTSYASAADLFTYILPTLSGKVVSGPPGSSVAISATVQLYAAGTTGYGAGPQAVGDPVQSDATTGAFPAFTYDCSKLPAPRDQLYLEAVEDKQVVLMTALGSCNSVSSSFPNGVTINEATTIASAYALSGFASADSNGGIDIGAPATVSSCTATNTPPWQGNGPSTCNYIGLKNAFATVQNLVDIPSGATCVMTPAYSSSQSCLSTAGSTASYNISYPPQARVNSLADVLAACANPSADGTGCDSLFMEATVGTSAPADTLQAALSIAQHPVNNAKQIAGLVPATPFTPTISSSDASSLVDWALAVVYEGAGLGASSESTTGMAIDATGNVWTTLENTYAIAYGGANNKPGMVTVFNNQGGPISPASTSSTVGGYQSSGVYNPQAIAIDQKGYAWLGNFPTGYPVAAGNPGSVSVLDVNGNPQYGTGTTPFTNPLLFNTAASGIAVDASNTAWVSSNTSIDNGSYCSGGLGGSILPLSGSASGGVTVTGNAVDTYTDNSSCPSFLAIDQDGNLWTYDYSGGGKDPYGYSLVIFGPDGSPVAGPYNYDELYDDPNIAIDSNGNGWIFEGGYSTYYGGYIDEISPAMISSNNANPNQLYVLDWDTSIPWGLGSAPIALDGASQAWTANDNDDGSRAYLFETNSSDTAFLSPMDSQGNPWGFEGWDASSGTPYPITAGAFMAVDSSGNVWLANGSRLSEFVGIAAPARTPLASALVGANLPGTKP